MLSNVAIWCVILSCLKHCNTNNFCFISSNIYWNDRKNKTHPKSIWPYIRDSHLSSNIFLVPFLQTDLHSGPGNANSLMKHIISKPSRYTSRHKYLENTSLHSKVQTDTLRPGNLLCQASIWVFFLQFLVEQVFSAELQQLGNSSTSIKYSSSEYFYQLNLSAEN